MEQWIHMIQELTYTGNKIKIKWHSKSFNYKACDKVHINYWIKHSERQYSQSLIIGMVVKYNIILYSGTVIS